MFTDDTVMSLAVKYAVDHQMPFEKAMKTIGRVYPDCGYGGRFYDWMFRTDSSINDIEVLEGNIPNKQLKMVLGWAAFHQDELKENWALAEKQQELFSIDPMK